MHTSPPAEVDPEPPQSPNDWKSQRDWVELQFMERERRLPFVLLNFFQHYRGDTAYRGAALKALGWYLVTRTGPAALVSGVGVVGILGLLLAWQANLLVHQQIERLDVQTHLNEAQRRSSLNFELSNILDALQRSNKPSPSLKARIAALSASLRPYYFVSYGRSRPRVAPVRRGWMYVLAGMSFLPPTEITSPALENTPLSPERAQLLRSLASLRVSVEELPGATFAFADFSRTEVSDVSFGGTILSSASFFGTYLSNVTFAGRRTTTDLTAVDFSCSTFHSVVLGSSSLYKARFAYVNLGSLNLLGQRPDVSSAQLLKADLRDADFHDLRISDPGVFSEHEAFDETRWDVKREADYWRITDKRDRRSADIDKTEACR